MSPVISQPDQLGYDVRDRLVSDATMAAAASPPQTVVSTGVLGTPGSTDRPIATVDTTTGVLTLLFGNGRAETRKRGDAETGTESDLTAGPGSE